MNIFSKLFSKKTPLRLSATQVDHILLDFFSKPNKNNTITKYYGYSSANGNSITEFTKLEEKKEKNTEEEILINSQNLDDEKQVKNENENNTLLKTNNTSQQDTTSKISNEDRSSITSGTTNNEDDFEIIGDKENHEIKQQTKNEFTEKFGEVHQNAEFYIVKNSNNQEVAVSFTVQDNAKSEVKDAPPMDQTVEAYIAAHNQNILNKNVPLVIPLVQTGYFFFDFLKLFPRKHFVTAFIDPSKQKITILDSRSWLISILYDSSDMKACFDKNLANCSINFEHLGVQKDKVNCGRWTAGVCIPSVVQNYQTSSKYQEIIKKVKKDCKNENKKKKNQKFENCGDKFKNNTEDALSDLSPRSTKNNTQNNEDNKQEVVICNTYKDTIPKELKNPDPNIKNPNIINNQSQNIENQNIIKNQKTENPDQKTENQNII